jgi:PAS domain S-box-containing protein
MERLRNILFVFYLMAKKRLQPLVNISFFFSLALSLLFAWLIWHTAGIIRTAMLNSRQLQSLHEKRYNIQTAQSALYALETGMQGFILSGDTSRLVGAAQQTATLYTALDNIKYISGNALPADSVKQLITQSMELYHRNIRQGFNAQPANNVRITTPAIAQMLERELRQTNDAIAGHAALQTAYINTLQKPFIWGGIILLLTLLANRFLRKWNRKLKNALGNSDERFHSFIEDAQVMMFIADLNGHFTYVNKKLTEISGYDREELVGKHYSIFTDAATTAKLRVAYSEQYAYNTPQTTHEFLCATKSGERRWVEQHLTLYRENGMIRGFQAIVKDIHDQKQLRLEMDALTARQKETQYRLQSILDHSTSLIFIKDLQGLYLLANKPFESMHGLRRGQATGKTDLDFAEAPFLMIGRENDQVVIEQKQPLQLVETVSVHGTERHIFMTRFPLFNSEQEMFGIGGIGMDITERVVYERELIAARKIAEEAKKAQEIFLANMSHEIRTPINGIMGMSYLLDKTAISTQQQEYLDGIKDASQNLLVIINDILDFSKMRAGKMMLEKTRLNIHSLVSKIVLRLKTQADKKGLALSCHVEEDIPTNLTGDAVRISQVLGNLIENAIKFTSKGSVTVNARVLAADETTTSIGFEVRDTGIGIPADKLEMIFESFTQSSAENTRKYGGTGLGLSICKELVTMQGGHIVVNSIEGKGSAFYVEIPFARYAGKGQEDEGNADSMPDNVLRNKKLLLAEDNPLNQKMAYYILQHAGASVDIAANGKTALQRALENEYDCILMDIQMPEIDGYQTTAMIRQTGNDVPIIAMTASAIAGEEEKCLRAGMNDYISKPFVPEALFLKILQCSGEEVNLSLPPADEPTGASDQFVDLHYIRSFLKADTDYMQELLQDFHDTLPGIIAELEQAAGKRQWEMVGFLVHRLKSSLGIIRIPPAMELAAQLEEQVKQPQQAAELGSQVHRLTTVLEDAYKEIAIEIRRMN